MASIQTLKAQAELHLEDETKNHTYRKTDREQEENSNTASFNGSLSKEDLAPGTR